MTTQRDYLAPPPIPPLSTRARKAMANPALRALLHTPAHRLAARAVLLLRYQGRFSGRRYVTPLTYAPDGPRRLLLAAGHPERKSWWRNFDSAPRPVSMRVHGREVLGHAHLLEPTDPEHKHAMITFTAHVPTARVRTSDPIVVVDLLHPI